MNFTGSNPRHFIRQLGVMAAAASLENKSLRAEGPLTHPSLRPAMDRVAACCLAWLNPQQEFLPTGGYEVAHDTGRWWDAMLRYEAVTGTRIPEQAEAAMMTNLRVL